MICSLDTMQIILVTIEAYYMTTSFITHLFDANLPAF